MDDEEKTATASPARERPRRGDELELRVDSLAQGGRGVARTDGGFVVFVAGGLPGDRVRARIGKSKRSHAEAVAVELLEAGAGRIADRCVHGGEPCPGAAWQGLPYDAQLAEKERQTREALERLGGFEGIELEPIVAAVEQWRYRNKLEYSFGPAAEGDPEPALGFHARGRWDTVIDVDDCLLASEANNAARNKVRAWARREDLPAFDGHSTGILRNLIVRDGRAGPQGPARSRRGS